jgi:hypothetical protein
MSGKVTPVACIAATLLAGCGSHPSHRVVVLRLKLPHALAAQFAALSDAVARELKAHDSCGALQNAATLDARARVAVASGAVPKPLRLPLTRATSELAARIQCIRPQPTHEKQHGKGKHKGHEGKGD